MGISLTHLLITLVVILIIFGAGKLPKVMGDLGRGMRNFREGLKSDNSEGLESNDVPKVIKHHKSKSKAKGSKNAKK
jgi:sec-independent protein translocase protein TatA